MRSYHLLLIFLFSVTSLNVRELLSGLKFLPAKCARGLPLCNALCAKAGGSGPFEPLPPPPCKGTTQQSLDSVIGTNPSGSIRI